MFEFDAGKFVLIAIVALLVIGPKELPRVMRQVGQALSKLRRLSSDFQAQFMEAMREADLEEVRTEAAKIAAAAKLDHGLDPLAGIRAELTKSIEATPETPATILPSHVDPLAEALAHHSEAAEESIQESIEARQEFDRSGRAYARAGRVFGGRSFSAHLLRAAGGGAGHAGRRQCHAAAAARLRHDPAFPDPFPVTAHR